MASVAIVAPFPNPHFVDIFFEDAFSKRHDVQLYCFRDMPSYRMSMDWQIRPFVGLRESFVSAKSNFHKIQKHDSYFFLGALDPNFMPALMIRRGLKLGKTIFLVSEGLKNPPTTIKRLCLSNLLDDHRLTLLCVGDGASSDFFYAGLKKPIHRKFGFFEKYCDFVKQKKTDNSIQLLSVGQLIDRKNFHLVLEVLSQIGRQLDAEVRYTICGEGEERSRLLELGYSLPSNISLLLPGNCSRETLRQHYLQADVFVMPSKYDGWGVVLNQAVHHALPIVVSNQVRSARNHLVDGGNNGIIFSDAAELRNALSKLILDEHLRARFSAHSLALSKKWNIESVAKKLSDLVDSPLLNFSDGLPLSRIAQEG